VAEKKEKLKQVNGDGKHTPHGPDKDSTLNSKALGATVRGISVFRGLLAFIA
jgi:hypothetical protein